MERYWIIRAPGGYLIGPAHRTRAEAIADTTDNFDQACYDARQKFPRRNITSTQRAVWQKLYRKGYRAVSVLLEEQDL